jgi:hypothetical protein
MLRFHKSLLFVFTVAAGLAAFASQAEDKAESYRLVPKLESGDAAHVTVSLEVGGELILPASEGKEGKESKAPMSVAAKMAYDEQFIAWWADPKMASRSLRRYSECRATLKTAEKGDTRELPESDRLIVAKALGDSAVLNGLEQPLSRQQYDLLDVVGNSLVLDRLLPNREVKEGEGWDHDAETIAALLGMDHVAVCEVRSIVTGAENHQVQIRLSGTVHGTVEGASSEMDLRGAYLFHLDEGRITKFNLAIKETRKPGEVSSGLDVVAKLSLVATPLKGDQSTPFDEATLKKARELSNEALEQLAVDSPQRGYKFQHSLGWYATAEGREHMSLRLLDRGDFLAHCNVTTLPVRPADKPMTLHEFESEVAKTLGDKMDKVEAATEWTNSAGYHCLGVIATGKADDVAMEWRNYLIAAEGMRQVAVSVTVEQELLERFADADKPIVDSLMLQAEPQAETALKTTVEKKRK